MRIRRWSRVVLLAALGMVAAAQVPDARAQVSAGATAAQAGQPKSLLITIVEGEGALNDIRTRTAREPIVEVDDENHKPVAGALVLFSLDKTGSSYANFAGLPSVSVRTDQAGRAVATGFQTARKKGTYKINVHASIGVLVADTIINESNFEVLIPENGGPPATVGVGSHHKVIWIVSGVLVAGAVAGIVLATQQSSPTTISTGTGTVGAPAAVAGIHLQLHARHP
jgi:hypothetical protein